MPSIGEYGRFDLSWIGGGTNNTRLSNWLDPGNSNILTTNTTNVSNLPSEPGLPIAGFYTVNNGTTQYSIANNTFQQIQVPRSSFVTISFTITNASPTFQAYNWSSGNSTSSGTLFTTTIQASAFGFSNVFRDVNLNAVTACGVVRRTYSFQIMSMGWSRMMTAPNPVSNEINVTLVPEEGVDAETQPTNSSLFRLTSVDTQLPVKEWRFGAAKQKTYKLNVHGLKPGVYVLSLLQGGTTLTSKVIIR